MNEIGGRAGAAVIGDDPRRVVAGVKGFSNEFEFVTRVSHRDGGCGGWGRSIAGEDAEVALVGDQRVAQAPEFRPG